MKEADDQAYSGRGPSRRPFWTSWLAFCMGVGVLFFFRGMVLVGFSPPFEGFDEPVHVAYLVHLNEEGTLPQFGKTSIPLSLYEEVVAYPHPRVAMPVVGRLGGKSYADFYLGAPPRLLSYEPLPLYQAQHPPLYYLCHQTIFSAFHRRHGIVAAIGVLRVINIVFAAIAVALFVYPVRRAVPDPLAARLAALAIGLYPMMVVYVARVGNDSMAMMFFAGAFLVLAGIDGDVGLRWRAATAGLLIGVGTMTKVIAFLLLPAGVAYLLWLALIRNLSWQKMFLGLVLLLAGYVVVCGHHHWHNLHAYGTLFSEAGSVINRDAGGGGGGGSVLANIRLHHLWDFFLVHLILSNLWMSGWSYLPPHPLFIWIWTGLLAVCAAGGVPVGIRILRGSMRLSDPDLRLGVFCMLVVGAVFSGTYAHALNSISAWGGITTPQYYTVAAYPALLTVAFILLAAYRNRIWFALVSGGLAGLFVLTESISFVTRSLPHWAASSDIRVIFRRLGELHWVFPSPVFAVAAAAGGVATLIALAWGTARFAGTDRSG